MDDVAISRLQSSSGIMEVATVLRTSQCPTIVDVARTNGPRQSPGYRGLHTSNIASVSEATHQHRSMLIQRGHDRKNGVLCIPNAANR